MEREELWVGVEAACPCFSEKPTDPVDGVFTTWTRNARVCTENAQSPAQAGAAGGCAGQGGPGALPPCPRCCQRSWSATTACFPPNVVLFVCSPLGEAFSSLHLSRLSACRGELPGIYMI